MSEPFQDLSNQYHQWLISRGVIISPKISIADLRCSNQGRGLVAKQNIEKNQLLFEIPRSALLLLSNCSLVHDHPSVSSKLQNLGAWESLIIVLLYEIHVKKNDSTWDPYFQVLPIGPQKTSELNQLVYWSDQELEHLQPSLILERIGKDTISTDFSKICLVISQEPVLKDLVNTTVEDYQDVASLIMSYSFDVKKEKHELSDAESDEEEDENPEYLGFFKAMVPLADTLNADTKLNNAQLFYEDDMLVMKSIQDISLGNQIYNTYADHPNSEILRRYGYVENQGSKHDFAEIPTRIIKDHFIGLSGMSSDLYDELMHILSSVLDVSVATDGAVEDLVLDSYDCFITSEVIMEFVFIVQILTILSAIHQQDPIDHLNSQEKSGLVDRVYNKCLQLIEGIKLTVGFKENYTQILSQRMKEYPSIAREALGNPTTYSRKTQADIVLKCEYQSLQNCSDLDETLKADNIRYTFVDDMKLIRNILKRKSPNSSDQSKKKVRGNTL